MNFSLVNGTTEKNERVQFTLDGKLGNLCGWFNDNFAFVLCRQLNFTSGRRLPRWAFGSLKVQMYISSLNCEGGEAVVTDCPMRLTSVGEYEYDVPEFQRPPSGPWYRTFHHPQNCYLENDDAAIQCYHTGFTTHKCVTYMHSRCILTNTSAYDSFFTAIYVDILHLYIQLYQHFGDPLMFFH